MRDQRESRGSGARTRVLVIGVCLLAAFSPTLADWIRHLAAEPRARYVVLFPLLFHRVAREEGPRTKNAALGIGLIALGIGIQLFAFGGNEPRFGRIALPLAAIGFGRFSGFGSWRSLALLLLVVPVPSAVLNAASPALENALRDVAALGVGPGDRPLGVEASDNGLALMPLLAGLAWYASLRTGRSIGAGVVRAVVAALLAIPIQVLALGAALVATPLVDAPTGRWLLTHGPVLTIVGIGLWWAERAARAAAEATAEAPH